MLRAIGLTHVDARRAATAAHEEQASIGSNGGLGLVVVSSDDSYCRAQRACVTESDAPDIEVASAVRRKDERLAVRGPGGLAIPLGATGDAGPLRFGRR